MMLKRTAKTCGPDTPTLVSSWRINPRNDGGKKADHRGEHGISRKPLRAGMSGVFRWLAVNTRVHTYYHSAHEAAGASGARHSPRPLFSGRMLLANLGRIAPRDRGSASEIGGWSGDSFPSPVPLCRCKPKHGPAEQCSHRYRSADKRPPVRQPCGAGAGDHAD